MNHKQNKKNFDVVSVGSWTVFDHLYRVEKLPFPGDTVKITDPIRNLEKIYWGGCSFNNIVTAAKLGAKTSIISVVGSDFEQSGYCDHLKSSNVNLEGLIIRKDILSGHSFLFQNPAGNTICLSNLGASIFRINMFPMSILSSAKVGIINYIFDEFTLQAASILAKSDAKVIISGSLITSETYCREFLEYANILICNEHEINQLLKFLGSTSIKDLFRIGLEKIIVTRGSKGSRLFDSKGNSIEIPIIPAKEMIDPVGAGDSFTGAFAFGLAFGYDTIDAIKLGAAVASFVVESIGSQSTVPDLSDVITRQRETSSKG